MISILLCIFIFGLMIGSFLNCLIWRLHTGESMWGRSHCPKCKQTIAWYDNIPVISYLLLLGKCRHCKKKISWQYPVVEFIVGVLFVFVFLSIQGSGSLNQILNFEFRISNGFFLELVRDWFLVAVMVIIFIYDLRWYLILDKVTIPSVIVFLILNLFLGFTWTNLLFSGLIGAFFFLIQFVISKGKWIGGGDIRLGLLMGIALGRLDLLIVSIMLAYFMGSIVGIALILLGKKKWGSEVPLGVFLSTSTVITLLWGQGIIDWYTSLL